ncbi:MAG: 2-hydroxyacid dehydrogenase [Cuniculiplasma sp.]
MKVLILAAIPENLRENLNKMMESMGLEVELEDDSSQLEGVEAIISSVNKLKNIEKYTERMPNLKMIQTLSAGVDLVDFSRVPSNILFCSNAGAYALPVAEHAVAMATALSKNLLLNHEKMRRGIFDQTSENSLMRGKMCGILGYGGIGREIGRICLGMGMKLQVIFRHRVDEKFHFSGTMDSLDMVLETSDLIFVSLPLNKFTHNLITGEKLNVMRRDAIFVNIARAGIVNEHDLFEYLRANPGFRAGIDVWWQEPISTGKFEMKYPFLDLPNVLGSPHNSGIVPEIGIDSFRYAMENVDRFAKGETPKNIVKREDYTY